MLRDIPNAHKEKSKDRYRTVFCATDFYQKHQDIFKLWKTRFATLPHVEKLQAWTVALSCLRRPTDWYGGKRQEKFLHSASAHQHSLTLNQIFLDTPILKNSKLPIDLNLMDFLNEYKVKAIPESCFRSLCFISTQRYPLFVTESVPTPQELLQIQISGRRIVSINEDFESWPTTLYSDRDFLGFILHDLIHADHFFLAPLHRDGQLGFYIYIQNFLQDETLQLLLESSAFRSGFEYIISDMNSHPVHLFQTLHSLLFTEFKDDVRAQDCWKNWAQKTKLHATEFASVLKVNSIEFNRANAQDLEDLCVRLGQIS